LHPRFVRPLGCTVLRRWEVDQKPVKVQQAARQNGR
jgi:hypothetical protein